MEILRGPTGLTPVKGTSVVAIGNFDGVHLGHQALLRATLAAVAGGGGVPTVLTFEPHPREVLPPAVAGVPVPARLQRFREKVEVLAQCGVQRLVVARFNDHLRQLAAEDFIRCMLVERLHTRHVVVGSGFRFGHRGLGSAVTLEREGIAGGFTTQTVPLVETAGETVSSTAVREALDAGDLARATRLLGRPYAVSGRVERGKQLGRTLGYPTLNLRLQRRRVPLAGILAVRVTGGGLQRWPAVASLGTRPTVDVDGEVLLEVHLFDWQGDLYGARVTVEFVAWQRAEQRFDSLPALVVQMNADAREARQWLAQA